jgi:tRNA pseudouridine38-40 synthase
MQVLSFRVIEPIPTSELGARINAHLPRGEVGIALAKDAPTHFNAHWRAASKEYRYRLRLDAPSSESQPPAAWTWSLPTVDVAALRATLAQAVGTHDFFAFHDKSSVARPRTIHAIEVVEGDEGLVDVRLRGEGFGRYMVRYLIGGAVAVASGAWTQRGFADALASGVTKERPRELSRAPAHGLVLWSVDYPAADDPFTAEERRAAANVPATPPFISPSDDLRTSRAGR